jgi:hypothetical protein
MKHILIILMMILSSKIFAQIEYPLFTVDSVGTKLVVLTLEQAQALDNKTDLLPLYEKMSTQINNVDSSCIRTIEEKDKTINSQDKLIKNKNSLIIGKDKEINNLNLQVSNYKITEETYKKEIENKNKEIDLHLNKIKRTKGKILIGGGIGLVVGFVTATILKP